MNYDYKVGDMVYLNGLSSIDNVRVQLKKIIKDEDQILFTAIDYGGSFSQGEWSWYYSQIRKLACQYCKNSSCPL